MNRETLRCRQILRECFWDYRISEEELRELAEQGTEQEKYFLFAKIIENSTDVLNSIRLFSPKDQLLLLLRYVPPGFNRHFLRRRYDILRYFLLGEQTDIPELRWMP